MQYHTNFLNRLIEERGYNSFLEIGFGTGSNFFEIKAAKKTSVDPVIIIKGDQVKDLDFVNEETKDEFHLIAKTSDNYFEGLDGRVKFDIIWIDGLHDYHQVERDIINSMKHLKKGGLILMHDILPHNEVMQRVPREQREWTGDCWRCWVGLKDKYPELGAYAIKDDYGIGVIPYSKEVKIEPGFSSQMLYKQFEEVKDQYFEA